MSARRGITKMKRSVWLILNLVMVCLFLGAHFLPIYSIPDGAGAADVFSYVQSISSSATSLAAFLIFVLLGVALELTALVFFILSAIYGENQYEKSDKRFGFGIVIFAFAGGELAMAHLGLKLNYMMFVSLAEAILGILAMIIHFKFFALLSDRRAQ